MRVCKTLTTIQRENCAKQLFEHPDDAACKLNLINSWQDILSHVSNKLSTYYISTEDMYMVGVIALLDCYTHVNTLPEYQTVYHKVYNTMKQQINSSNNNAVKMIQNSVSASYPSVKHTVNSLIDTNVINCDYRLDMLLLNSYLHQFLDQMNDHRENIIDLYYGWPTYAYNIFKLENEELTNDLDISIQFSAPQLAKIFNVNYSRIRQIRHKVLTRLHNHLPAKLKAFDY